jgi:peptidyl-prolyl cis-trans isomerase B (cyclophilin B)
LAAARLTVNYYSERLSSGCQFYIFQGYKHSDQQLNSLESANYEFPDINRPYYKVKGGYPGLDLQYTIFGEVIEGLEVIGLICDFPIGKQVKERPNMDVKMTVTLIE